MSRRTLLPLVLTALAGLAAFGVTASRLTPAAHAEDGAEPEGEEIEALQAFSDPRNMLRLKLPRNWRSAKNEQGDPVLAIWNWPVGEEQFNAFVYVLRNPNVMRAGLARANQERSVEVIPDSRKAADGWTETAWRDGVLVVRERQIEAGGAVYMVRFITHRDRADKWRDLAESIFASFELTKPPGPSAPRDGWTEKKVKDFRVWTDGSGSDVDEALKLVERYGDVRKLMPKLLPGKPLDPSTPIVKALVSGSVLDELSIASTGGKLDQAGVDLSDRSVLLRLASRSAATFDGNAQLQFAQQYVAQYFGGTPPYWINVGLLMYLDAGVTDGGKPQKPEKERFKRVLGVVRKASRRLDQWFDLTSADVPNAQEAQDELYAWVWFFRHAKQGKRYAGAFDAYVSTLRDTGDPLVAAAKWEGTDFAAMLEDFKRWGESEK